MGGAKKTGGAWAGLARRSCCAPRTRSRTQARGPGHRGGRSPRPAQASRSGAQRKGSGRGRRAVTEDPSLGPAEVSVATEVAGRRRRGPVGAFVCGARPQSRRLPVPPSQAPDGCRTPCPGRMGTLEQCKISCIRAARAGRRLQKGTDARGLGRVGSRHYLLPWSHLPGPCTLSSFRTHLLPSLPSAQPASF